jgi:hypothetical protein
MLSALITSLVCSNTSMPLSALDDVLVFFFLDVNRPKKDKSYSFCNRSQVQGSTFRVKNKKA